MRGATILVTLALVGGLTILGGAKAVAAGPPNYGVMEPASDGCPWPDFLNPSLRAGGVEKCLPQQVAWTDGEGIRIVTDALVGSSGSGWVNFWCETKEGLKYTIGLQGLAANSAYTVTAGSYSLGVVHTDARGAGQTGGVLRLPPGFYEFDITVWDGATEVVSTADDDPVDIVVFP